MQLALSCCIVYYGQEQVIGEPPILVMLVDPYDRTRGLLVDQPRKHPKGWGIGTKVIQSIFPVRLALDPFSSYQNNVEMSSRSRFFLFISSQCRDAVDTRR